MQNQMPAGNNSDKSLENGRAERPAFKVCSPTRASVRAATARYMGCVYGKRINRKQRTAIRAGKRINMHFSCYLLQYRAAAV